MYLSSSARVSVNVSDTVIVRVTIGFNFELSKRRFDCEVIILKLTYNRERKRPWVNDFGKFSPTSTSYK